MTVVFVARDAEGIDHWGEGEGGEEEGKILDGLYLKRYFPQFLGWATALRPGRPGTKTLAASAAAVVGRSTMSSRVVPRPPRRRGGGGKPGAKALAAAADAAATSAAVGGRSTGHCRSTLPSSPPPPLPPTASPPADPPTPRVAASAVTLGRPPLATRRVPRGVAAPRRGSPATLASRRESPPTNARISRTRRGGRGGTAAPPRSLRPRSHPRARDGRPGRPAGAACAAARARCAGAPRPAVSARHHPHDGRDGGAASAAWSIPELLPGALDLTRVGQGAPRQSRPRRIVAPGKGRRW